MARLEQQTHVPTKNDAMLIQNAHIFAENGNIGLGWLRVRDGKIDDFATGDAPVSDVFTIDAEGHFLAAGFIDLHIHGGIGFETMDADPDALRSLAQFYARHGVTRFLPTTWSASHERIMDALHVIKAMVGIETGGAAILGAHVEGPYLNPAKSGAQDSSVIRRATSQEITDILKTDIVKLIALAPEYSENRAQIKPCVDAGAVVSAAHTDATYDDMLTAVEQGLTQSTHTFNAMRGLQHRNPGTVGAALSFDAIYCEVIPDFNHLHPAAIKILFRAKGADKTIIITDAVRGTGLPDGSEYSQNGRLIRIHERAARLSDGTLAGSTLTMDEAIRNFAAAIGAPLVTCMRCASLTPAQSLGVDHLYGSIAIGKQADLILTDSNLNIYMTMVDGQIVWLMGDASQE